MNYFRIVVIARMQEMNIHHVIFRDGVALSYAKLLQGRCHRDGLTS